MFDVIIYAALATVVVVVFYSVLGKQTGFGGVPEEKSDPFEFGMDDPNRQAEPEADPEVERLGLSGITRLDPSFSIAHFMSGATAAYSKTEGSVAHISVLYEADLTSALRDADGELVMGDPDVLSSVSEVWEYIRDMKSDDLNWRLANVEPSEGDALEADPSPDTTV